MATPRIFVSSTFFDLIQIRTDLEQFIKGYGFEAVLNERGKIPYNRSEPLEDACYREVKLCDMLIAIIGGRFGSASKQPTQSISQMEIESALDNGKQVFIFIQKNVYTEYKTYLVNRDAANFNCHYVDDKNIYVFIEKIASLPQNNPIFDFETAQDVISILKVQWAGFFYQYLQEYSKEKETKTLQEIESTARTLSQLVGFLT